MINNLDFTFIGKHSSLNGNFHFSSNTKIAGTLEGEINISNKAKLTLEMGSIIKGKIIAHHIEIYGQFEGEIEASGTIVVFPTGILEGKIIAKHLEVLPGANLNITGHTQL